MILQGQINFRPALPNNALNYMYRYNKPKFFRINNNNIVCIMPWVWYGIDDIIKELENLNEIIRGRHYKFSGQFFALKGDPNKFSKWKYYVKNGKIQSESAVFNFVKVYKPRPNRVARVYAGPKNSPTPRNIVTKLKSRTPTPQVSLSPSPAPSRSPSPPPAPSSPKQLFQKSNKSSSPPPPPTIHTPSRSPSRSPSPPAPAECLRRYYAIASKIGHKNRITNEVMDHYLHLLYHDGTYNLKDVAIYPASFFTMLKLKDSIKEKTAQQQMQELFELKGFGRKKWNFFTKVIIPCFWDQHWTLVQVYDRGRRMAGYDSENNDMSDIFKPINDFIMFQKLKKIPPSKIEEVHCPQQDNDYDCGVFVMEFARTILHEGNGVFEQKDMPNIRKRIKEEIRNNRLVRDYQYLP